MILEEVFCQIDDFCEQFMPGSGPPSNNC